MKKRDRRPHTRQQQETEEPLSAGRVEYLEAARARVRARSLRRTVIIVAVLAAVVAFATGFVGESVARVKDAVDSISIALMPNAGWPQNTGITDVLQAEQLDGGFVVLGEDSCAVYSAAGNRLNSIQSGYARPALAAGTTHFVLYNRSGNELRVESRTQNLYTKTMENSIYLCAVAGDGKLAVVTESIRSAALLTVFSATMNEQLTWELTSSEGVPLRMAFSADGRRLAVAAVTSSSGQLTTNLYVLSLGSGDPVLVDTYNGTPQYLSWLSSGTVLAVYDGCAAVCSVSGGRQAVYDFGGRTLTSLSAASSGGVALLFSAGQTCEAVLLDSGLNVQYSGSVPLASRILRTGSAFYLLTNSTLECFDASGSPQWSQTFSMQPQAVLAGKNDSLLVLCGNTVQQVSAPEAESET